MFSLVHSTHPVETSMAELVNDSRLTVVYAFQDWYTWWRNDDGEIYVDQLQYDFLYRYPYDAVIVDYEVCLPGWYYWYALERLTVPLELNLGDPNFHTTNYGGVVWERDANGDVDIYFVSDLIDPEYDLGGL